MQTQFKQLKDCKKHDLFCYCGKLYCKVEPDCYTTFSNRNIMYNAVNIETGKILWIDLNLKVEVIVR